MSTNLDPNRLYPGTDRDRGLLMADLSATDAWGRVHRQRVIWRPETVKGVDHGRDNVRLSPVAWGDVDHPPVQLVLSHTGHVDLVKVPEQILGDTAVVVEPFRAESRSAIRAGTYWLAD